MININKLIFLPIWIKLSVILIIFSSVILFYFFFKKIMFYKNNVLIWFFRNIWFLPISYNISLTQINLIISSIFFKFIEIRWSELLIFNYVNNLLNNFFLRKFLDYLSYIYIIPRSIYTTNPK